MLLHEFMQLFHLFRYRHITAVISGSQAILNHHILSILVGHSTSPAGLPVELRRKLLPPPPAATAALFISRVKVASRVSGRKSDIVFNGCLSPPGESSHATISACEPCDEKSRAPPREWEAVVTVKCVDF